MKAIIFSAALVFAGAMPTAQAGVMQFSATVVDAAGKPVSGYRQDVGTIIEEFGPRHNVVTETFDELADSGDGTGWLSHYQISTYDVSGFHRDYYVFDNLNLTLSGNVQYTYVSGTIKYDPAAALHPYDGPVTMRAQMLMTGDYEGPRDSDDTVRVGIAQTNSFTDLFAKSRELTYDRDYVVATTFMGDVALAPGASPLSFLFYVPPNLNPSTQIFSITGPRYDFATYRLTERLYLDGELVQLPVPEPTTWAMLVAGIGIVGAARRRKTAA